MSLTRVSKARRSTVLRLSWLRTALMTLVSGITMIKLFEGVAAMEVFGGVLIPLSLLAAGWGFRRFLQTRASIAAAVDE